MDRKTEASRGDTYSSSELTVAETLPSLQVSGGHSLSDRGIGDRTLPLYFRSNGCSGVPLECDGDSGYSHHYPHYPTIIGLSSRLQLLRYSSFAGAENMLKVA